jgi:hypothetical protein
MHLVARARHVVARRPWLYWLVVTALAGCAALITAGAVAGIDDARRSWGEARAVLVASTDLSPGDLLTGRTTLRPRPLPMLPEDAIDTTTPDAIARQHVAAGEVLVDADVASGTLPTALIPAGWQGVPVAEAVPSGVAVGARVAVASTGAVLADDGVVVGLTESGPIVAVPADEAASVAQAGASGELVLLVLP